MEVILLPSLRLRFHLQSLVYNYIHLEPALTDKVGWPLIFRR